ncbi:MAG: GAF domain-containing protein [Anaerolineales bacterium]|nr:GAF domain-containing protein [Anaerolineales bacterium]
MDSISSNKQFSNPEDATRLLYKNWRERFALPLLIGVLVFGAFVLIPAVNASTSPVVDAIFITTFIVTGIVTVVRFSYAIRMTVFLLSIYMLGVGELITHGILGDSLIFFFALIVFSTILLSPRTGIVAVAVNVLTFVVFAFLFLEEIIIPLNPNASPAQLADWFNATGVVVMFGVVIILGFQRLEREFTEAQKQIDSTLKTLETERNNLENNVEERTQQLRKINEIGRFVAAILDPSELLPRALQLIETEFKFYYAAFFLVNSGGQWAELTAATGEAGRVLRENKHRLDLNGSSMIAKAIRERDGQVSSWGKAEQAHLDNPLLPYTRSQIVLPLIIGDEVLGALEIHETRENAFQQADLSTFQNMANEIAIALENARLFQEAQQSLAEMRATQRQYLQGAWQTLTDEQDLVYALGDNDTPNGNEIEIPLSLREQVIGQLQLFSAAEWSPEQKSLVEAIVTQASLALENARLVEESQSIAAREKMANDIIAKVWASTSMEGILQTAVRELGRSLEAAEVEIEISMDKDENE